MVKFNLKICDLYEQKTGFEKQQQRKNEIKCIEFF